MVAIARSLSFNSLDGFNTGLRLGKVSGKIQYYAQGDIKSTYYDPRDLGYIQTANVTGYTGNVSYNQFTSTKNFLRYRYSFNATLQRMYRPNAFSHAQFDLEAFWVFKNFWDVTLHSRWLAYATRLFYFRTCTRSFCKKTCHGLMCNWKEALTAGKSLFFSYDWQQGTFFNASPKKSYYNFELSLRYRFSNKISVEVSHAQEAETNYIVNTGLKETSGDPIVGFVDFKDITTNVTGIYSFDTKTESKFPDET